MSAAWNGGLTRSLVTTTGDRCEVIYGGAWSHGFGPDFTGAMIDCGPSGVRTGDVEIHIDAADWGRHGHHLDPRYNGVILHVVARHDGRETRRADGATVPIAILDVPDAALFAIDQELPDIWSTLGHSVCAGDLALREPARLRAAFLHLGDRRFDERVSCYQGELAIDPLPTLMLRGLFDAFGYSENRVPMRTLFDMLHESALLGEIPLLSGSSPLSGTTALLLGAAGFLPLSPGDAHFAGLEADDVVAIEWAWRRQPSLTPLPATAWTRARTRPANHPAARLVQLARLLSATGGDPSGRLLQAIRDGGDVAVDLRALTSTNERAGLGAARATAIAASVVLPVAMAHAHHRDHHDLEDATARAWAALPRSEWSRPARRGLQQAVGDAPIERLGERAIQGLIHLDRHLCAPRRCYECPVAAEVIRDRQRQRTSTPAPVHSILPT